MLYLLHPDHACGCGWCFTAAAFGEDEHAVHFAPIEDEDG